jgi:DeoR/GlpR family transcriptional regulator of sugar metabolism
MASKEQAKEWKQVLAQHAATHLPLKYGQVIQIGSGTTLNYLMDEIIRVQTAEDPALDLVIVTSNLQVFWRGRNALYDHPKQFANTQVILTGGLFHSSLDSLVGAYAAEGIRADVILPDTLFFGAAGLSFQGGVSLSYQFDVELATQVAYATRQVHLRVLLCDHTKLGKRRPFRADLSIESLLEKATDCLVLSTLPDDDIEARENIAKEQEALTDSLKRLASNLKYRRNNFTFRLLERDGRVNGEISLKVIRGDAPDPVFASTGP